MSEMPPPPGTTAHFEWLHQQIRTYWDSDLTFVARSLKAMGVANAATALNRMKGEKRTAPPSKAEVTALDITFWDNWNHTGGKRPKEGQPNHDKARFKVEVELFDQPEGQPIFGTGNKAVNSIYAGTAIAMDRKALLTYLADKREGKKIARKWSEDEHLAEYADNLEAVSDAYPDALIGPLSWTSNKKIFVPGLFVVVQRASTKEMSITLALPDGHFEFKRWTRKRTNGTDINGPNGEVALQCRATNRRDQSSWRNSKLG